MKINRKQWLAGLVMGLGVAMGGSAMAASIATTKHNLGTGGTGAAHVTAGTGELCVFCHTPHAAASAQAPLWNKNLPAAGGATGVGAGTYTLYTSSTMQGSSVLNGTTTVSHACLSCHDGTQAMDNIVNAPTTGTGTTTNHNYDPDGDETTATEGRDWTWTVDANIIAASGKMVTSGTAGQSIAMLGTDLSNDHPVGIPYGGGEVTAGDYADSNLTTLDPDFNAGTDYYVVNGNYWIDTDSSADTNGFAKNGDRNKTDMILFYDGTTANVECATCHDVHNNSNVPFLRMANNSTGAPSGLCLACHTK